MPKPKLIETPEILYSYFERYKEWVQKNPLLEHDFIGPKAVSVHRTKKRCLTFEGFDNWCFKNTNIKSVEHYFINADGVYNQYLGICTRIKREIRQDQIEGGMAGIYNSSITQRLNGLVEKNETKLTTEQPLFGPDKNV